MVDEQCSIRKGLRSSAIYHFSLAGVLDSIGRTLSRVERMPEAHAVVYRGVRRALAHRFPFSIYYRVEGAEVVILAVIHSRRDPNDWKSRA